MVAGSGSGIGEVLPAEAWEILKTNPDAILVDVRTKAEWAFVGVPDISSLDRALVCVEWASFPGMVANPNFVSDVLDQTSRKPGQVMLFLCRSGARSLKAAVAITEALTAQDVAVECINIAEGFEGDLDAQNHRGAMNGWQSRGLAWRQS